MQLTLVDQNGNSIKFDETEFYMNNSTYALCILLLCLNPTQREAMLWHLVSGVHRGESLTTLASNLGLSRSTLSRRLRAARDLFTDAVQTTACVVKDGNDSQI